MVPRAPGRVGGDNAEDQQARLLAAALDCFVRARCRGHAPARYRAAGWRYPGVGELLLSATSNSCSTPWCASGCCPPWRDWARHSAHAGDDIEATVAAFVGGLFAVVERHPWWPQLWVREVLCEGGALRGLVLDEVAPSVARVMVAQLQRCAGARRNQSSPRSALADDLAGRPDPVSIAGAPIWRQLLGAKDLDAAAIARHALVLLKTGMAPP